MIRILLLISILSILLTATLSCQTGTKKDVQPEYTRFVGDILSDTIQDNSDFEVCNGDNSILQYFNTGEGFKYKGEKPELIEKIKGRFKPISETVDQNGYIRIRFIVNCKGESGRYRMISSDFNYEPKEFDEAIVSQLLTLVKELDGWEILTKNDNPLDYYIYLIFKIENGRISEILP